MTEKPSLEPQAAAQTSKLLGPFLGHVTSSSVKVWLHMEAEAKQAYVTLHRGSNRALSVASGTFNFSPEKLFTDCIEIDGLCPDTTYYYQLWLDANHSVPLDLEGLTSNDLHFRTLSDDADEQIDFVMMSCHNPTVAGEDGYEGHAVWADIPQIISVESNKEVRFAVLVGDQVYADAWQNAILAEEDDQARLKLYLEAYRRFWSNIHYRRVMCSLPAVMMWDDHDITDGWGSTADSFVEGSSEFKPNWLRLFGSASAAFAIMQASRNPPPLSNNPKDGFDCCFKLGRWGFVLLDLRTNRNLKKAQLMAEAQLRQIKTWLDRNKKDLSGVFVVSPVVFSHGSPVVDDLFVSLWPAVMSFVDWIARQYKWGKGLQSKFNDTLYDIRDDIRDSWGAKDNAAQTDAILDHLFDLQNDPDHPLGVVVLSGDIHTSGYASIYSSAPKHAKRSSIPHITSSAVAYAPFNWLLEAVYRHAAKTVALGTKGIYSSQVSHHFCSRGIALLSIRPKQGVEGHQLKVKYYLEGFPEPQILLFDLDRASHRENIAWAAQDKVSPKEYAPSATVDMEALLEKKVEESGKALDWQHSVVDLMKALDLDSSLGARKRLGRQWGYTGALDGSAEMNTWLRNELLQRFKAGGGKVEASVPTENL